jgi:hypothetical protein
MSVSFLIDGRVVTKKAGRVPLTFSVSRCRSPPIRPITRLMTLLVGHPQSVQVGMKTSKLPALFGAPKLQMACKGRPAEYAIYRTSPSASFGRFTSIDGVLIAFADGGHTPLSQVLVGR